MLNFVRWSSAIVIATISFGGYAQNTGTWEINDQKRELILPVNKPYSVLVCFDDRGAHTTIIVEATYDGEGHKTIPLDTCAVVTGDKVTVRFNVNEPQDAFAHGTFVKFISAN